MRSIKHVAFAFDRACAHSDTGYALVDGFAVMAWGIPRATMDVDAIVHLGGKRLTAFVAACNAEGFLVDHRDLVDALGGGGHATISDRESPYHVDLKPARTPDELRQVKSAREVSYPDGRLRVARPEDTIAYKLLFGSPHDYADARGIAVRQREILDWRLLRDLCRRLRVEAKMRGLMRDADVQSP